jgi:hypothetical protein
VVESSAAVSYVEEANNYRSVLRILASPFGLAFKPSYRPPTNLAPLNHKLVHHRAHKARSHPG